MKARLLVLAMLAAGIAGVPATALGGPPHPSSNSKHFPDATGEDPQAPDITAVDVSNTNAGLITFKIRIANRPTLTPDMAVFLIMNTDGKTSTGDPGFLGADYLIDYESGGFELAKWNGTTFVLAQSAGTLSASYDASGATISIGASDLGATKAIKFLAETVSGITTDAAGNPDVTNAHRDYAPNPGNALYAYDVLMRVTLDPLAYLTTPKSARAGASYSASLAATESDTQSLVSHAAISCVAEVGGVRIASKSALANGVATCFWLLPRGSRGKTIVGSISIAIRGATLTRRFSARIR